MTRKDVTFRLNSRRPFVSIARARARRLKVIVVVMRVISRRIAAIQPRFSTIPNIASVSVGVIRAGRIYENLPSVSWCAFNPV